MGEESDSLSVGMECIVKITIAGYLSIEEDIEIVSNCLNRIHFPEEVIIAEVLYPPARQEPFLIHRHRDKDDLYFEIFAKGPPVEEWIEEWKKSKK